MYGDWNPPTPIETLYEQLIDGQQFALKGGETIHDSQLVRKGYEIIGKTGLFNEDCKEWRKKQKMNKPSKILNIFSLLLTMIAVKTTRQQEVLDTVLIQSNKLFITK